MTLGRVWDESEDGTIAYVSPTKETIEGALNVIRQGFFVHEAACRAVGVSEEPGAMSELEELVKNALKDGVSLLAVEKSSEKVVAAAINKIQVKDSGEGTFFQNFANSCVYPSAKALVQFMIEADSKCDVFEEANVDCLLEVMFLATLPSSRGKGLARRLCKLSIELVKELKNGNNIKIPLDNEVLPLEPTPKSVAAIFTSDISQKVGRALNFKIAAVIPYSEFVYQGKTFSEILANNPKCCTLEYHIV